MPRARMMDRMFERTQSPGGRPPLWPWGTARQRLAPPPGFAARLLGELRDADVPEGTLYLAWQVADWAPPDAVGAAEREQLLALVARALMAVAQGSTRLRVDAAARALLARVPDLVALSAADDQGRRPLVLDGEHLYLQKLLACEQRLAAALRLRLAGPALFDEAAVAAAVEEASAAAGHAPTDEQRTAVRAAVAARFAVITGGPGTGKTTIALTLVRALARLGVPPAAVALAAPTGKAAQRLEEAVAAAGCPPAQTLHRLLGYSPGSGTFRHDERTPLAQRAVIVDEGSMIDLFLMERLARAVDAGALLVVMGDADQLPSVAAGAVFRDLAPLGVRLGRSFRMDPGRVAGRRIFELARAVNQGDAAALVGGAAAVVERAQPGALAWDGVELVPSAARAALLEDWFARRIASAPALTGGAAPCELRDDRFAPEDEARLTALHRHHQASRVLCVTRGRPTGVEAVNEWIHARVAGDDGAGPPGFLPGEPVLVGRNDYQRGLFNGDQGLIVATRARGRTSLVAAFPAAGGRWIPFELDGLRDTLALCFAMTVHKAQGSEFDDLLLLLPDTPLPLFSRELLYTALTRARRSVVMCGSPAILSAAASNGLARSSGVAERLR